MNERQIDARFVLKLKFVAPLRVIVAPNPQTPFPLREYISAKVFAEIVAVLRTAGAGSSPIGLRDFMKMQFS